MVLEVQLYFLIPLIALIFLKSRKLGILTLVLIIAWNILTSFVTDMGFIHFDETSTRRSINFFLGIAFYQLDKYLQEINKIPSEKTLLLITRAVFITFTL